MPDYTEKQVSFYTDLSKHYEFQTRLKEVLDNPQSNIVTCSMSKSTSDRFCLFFETKDSKRTFNHASFDFYTPFSKESDAYYLDLGFSQTDIDGLKALLDGYAFRNAYEGLFFASLFFGPELNPNKAVSIYFKFVANADKNRHIVNGKKCIFKQATVRKQSLAYELNLRKHKFDLTSGLYECNTYNFHDYPKLADCVDHMKKYVHNVPNPELMLVEFYYDVEYLSSYVTKVSKLSQGELVEVDIQDLLNTAQ